MAVRRPTTVAEADMMWAPLKALSFEARKAEYFELIIWIGWTALELADHPDIRLVYPDNPSHRGRLASRIVEGLLEYDAEHGVDSLDTARRLDTASASTNEWCVRHPAYSESLRHGVSVVNREVGQTADFLASHRQKVHDKVMRERIRLGLES